MHLNPTAPSHNKTSATCTEAQADHLILLWESQIEFIINFRLVLLFISACVFVGEGGGGCVRAHDIVVWAWSLIWFSIWTTARRRINTIIGWMDMSLYLLHFLELKRESIDSADCVNKMHSSLLFYTASIDWCCFLLSFSSGAPFLLQYGWLV